MNLNQETRNFINSIKRTKEFVDLKEAQKDIAKDKILKKEVEEFNKKQMEIFSQNKNDKNSEAKIKQLNKKYDSLSQIPKINNFFIAGKRFNEMLNKVHKEINNSISSDLKFK